MAKPPLRIPLTVQPSNRLTVSSSTSLATAVAKDAKLVNAFLMEDPTAGELVLTKRPGLVARTGPATNGEGIFYADTLGGLILAVVGGELYKGSDARTSITWTDIGAITSEHASALRQNFTYVLTTDSAVQCVWISVGSDAYYYSTSVALTASR